MLAVPAFAQDYTIMAQASPGCGWDATARTLQSVLQAEGIAPSVEVINVPGAGGTVGLAQFATGKAGDPSKLIVGGYVMVGAILTNDSPVMPDDVTPIARLSGENVAITGDQRLDGIDAPTLAEAGYDVVVQNWRMVAAAPGITPEQTAGIIADFDRLNASEGWAKALETQGWMNIYLAGSAFAEVLREETAATESILRDIGLIE